MACNNNTPKNGYVYIENLVVEFDNKFYPINNIVIKDENIYWNSEDPFNLYTSNDRIAKDNLLFIIKNMNGNSVIMNNPKLRLIFDNFDKEKVVENIKTIKNEMTEYTVTMETMSNDVENLSDKYKEDKSFDEIKEDLNTSLIDFNSNLIYLNTSLKKVLNDGKFTAFEKGEINSKLNETNNLCVSTLAYADALLDLYCQYLKEDDKAEENYDVFQYKVLLETYMSQLKVDLSKLTSSAEEKMTSDVAIPITSCITNMIESLVNLKTACSELKFLGSGGQIPSEIYQANDRIDTLTTQLNDLQESMLSSMNTEKQEIANILDDIRVVLNKIVTLHNNVIHTNGVMTTQQYNSFKSYAFSLQSFYTQIQGYYEVYYSNVDLSDVTKLQLKSSFDDFNKKHYAMMSYVNNKLSDLNISNSDRSAFTKAYQEYKDSRYVLSSKLTICINEINSNGSQATLDELKKTFQTQIDSLKTQVSTLSDTVIILQNNYEKLDARLKKLES